MPATCLGFDSVLSRQTSFLKRIRENLQSVLTLPRVALAVPRSAAGLPIHLLDESRTVRNAKAQFGSIGLHAIVCAGLILAVWHRAATHLAKRPATGLGPFQLVAFAAPKWMREAARRFRWKARQRRWSQPIAADGWRIGAIVDDCAFAAQIAGWPTASSRSASDHV